MARDLRLETRIPTRLSRSDGRRFGLTVGGAFGVLGGIALWRGHGTAASVLFACALPLGVAAILVPTRLGPIERAWMGFAHQLSRVTTPVFMAVVYFGVLTPIGLLMRLGGRRPLAPRKAAASFWRTRPTEERRSDLRRQF